MRLDATFRHEPPIIGASGRAGLGGYTRVGPDLVIRAHTCRGVGFPLGDAVRGWRTGVREVRVSS
ncbi:hypothetical protein Cci01nite_74240 [Catellatospora citrea]|uniref:Uncharacterized protein n=1 Tax=Catellatospora citrea TaxID=53366 RepID=A0A8J3KSF3_9ACTN|nr:hypothetical protein Cci01nite_74240 [Catellatospora citrea]